MSNSPRNGPESAKSVSVDYRHVNAPRGSLIMEITLGPQNSELLSKKWDRIGKTVSVDDRHVIAPWGSTTMEIALGPQNGE